MIESHHDESTDLQTSVHAPQLNTEETEQPAARGRCGSLRRPRAVLAGLGSLGVLLQYWQRANLSVALVSMVNSTVPHTNSYLCPDTHHALPRPHYVSESSDGDQKFDWDAETQGAVLGAFFWGCAATNILGGRAAEYLGGKVVFGAGVVVSSLLTGLAPLSASRSLPFFMACRIATGAAQGVTLPALNSLLASWVLPHERSKYTTIVFSGFQLGTVVGMVSSGWLASSSVLGGWPSAFYVPAAAGVVWGVAWLMLVTNRPQDHPGVSSQFLQKLQQHEHCVKQREQAMSVPWMAVMRSLPFLAVLVAALGNDYGFYTLMTQLPSYLANVLGYDLSSNGMLSAVPYLLMWAWSLGWAALMHCLTHSSSLSILAVRRLSMAVALYGPMVALVVLAGTQCRATASVAALCLGGALNGAVNSGYLCSHQDLAPNLAGTLLGVTNTAGALMGIASPGITGLIMQANGETLWAWQLVFMVSAAVYMVTCTFYLAFVASTVQPWNVSPTSGVAGDDTTAAPQHPRSTPAILHPAQHPCSTPAV